METMQNITIITLSVLSIFIVLFVLYDVIKTTNYERIKNNCTNYETMFKEN